ncbi:MAG: heme-binding protein [Acidobacteria bacterium]|nr:heme-binding protein [Acidobacteriota bacterium]
MLFIIAFSSPRARAQSLTTADVQTLIAQAVSAAAQLNQKVTVAVTDREGNVLGVFVMTGASATTQIRSVGALDRGLEGFIVPASAAAISKAGTGALFSTSGNAFTTRTAGFIIQEHFPPGIDFRAGGPLYGVQFSSLTCSDIKEPGLPLGLSGDAGGLPVYKNGVAVGGIGIEGDGFYTVDRDPADFDQPVEEVIAASGVRGYEAPALIRGDNIIVDGIRLPYANITNVLAPQTIPFGMLPGSLLPSFPVRAAQPSAFAPATVGGIGGEASARFFPFVGSTFPTPSTALTAADVNLIISHAAQTANITRAAIRQPLGSNARVSIAVVDTEGNVLGIFRTADAPVFGFDVSVQKARSAVLFSRSDAATLLRNAGMGAYADRAAADSVPLNGTIAYSARAIGFLHRPFFPDGINNTQAAPFSTALGEWSPFNVGLQLDLIRPALVARPSICSLRPFMNRPPCLCSSIRVIRNGLQIFAGSIPLYKSGALVGAIGISGDGIDQDDFIAAGGSQGYAPPAAIRADQLIIRGVRLPFVKFPRDPTL